MKPTRRAFTLIELLFVMALLAILLALLTPSFYRVQEKARRLYCSARLHNIGLALGAYAGRNNAIYPNSGFAAVRPYWLWDVDYQTRDMIVHEGVSRELFYCPSSPWQNSDDLWTFSGGYAVLGYWFLTDRALISDAMRVELARRNEQLQRRAGETNDPAREILMADAVLSTWLSGDINNQKNHDFDDSKGGWIGIHRSPHLVPSGVIPEGGNLLFGDGAIRWREFRSMTPHNDGHPTHWW